MKFYYTPPPQKRRLPGYVYILSIVIAVFLYWLILQPSTLSLNETEKPSIVNAPNESSQKQEKQLAEKPTFKNKTLSVKSSAGDNLSVLFDKAHISELTLLSILKTNFPQQHFA